MKASSGRPLQWLRASTERRRWCSRGRRRRLTRRGGDWGTVAVRTTGTAASASGVGKKRAARIWGGRGRRRGREESGVSGREARGSGGVLAPLSTPSPARWCGGDRPLFRPRSGEQGRGRGGVGDGLGRLGRGSAQLGQGPGGVSLPFFVLFSVFFLFIFFSVFIYL